MPPTGLTWVVNEDEEAELRRIEAPQSDSGCDTSALVVAAVGSAGVQESQCVRATSTSTGVGEGAMGQAEAREKRRYENFFSG